MDLQFICVLIIFGFTGAAWLADTVKIGYGKHL